MAESFENLEDVLPDWVNDNVEAEAVDKYEKQEEEEKSVSRIFSKQTSLSLYYIKQIDSMLPCVCSVIDHRRRQNVVRTSVA